jgi:hypothetical protein
MKRADKLISGLTDRSTSLQIDRIRIVRIVKFWTMLKLLTKLHVADRKRTMPILKATHVKAVKLF